MVLFTLLAMQYPRRLYRGFFLFGCTLKPDDIQCAFRNKNRHFHSSEGINICTLGTKAIYDYRNILQKVMGRRNSGQNIRMKEKFLKVDYSASESVPQSDSNLTCSQQRFGNLIVFENLKRTYKECPF